MTTSNTCRWVLGVCMAATPAFGQFGAYQEVTDSIADARSIRSADMDGDGDLDVFALSFPQGQILAMENLGGGLFGPSQVVNDSPVDADGSQQVLDLNGDGNVDLLFCSAAASSVSWFEGGGDGTFEDGEVLGTVSGGLLAVDAADFDGDGGIDLLLGSFSTGLYWQRRQGTTYALPESVGTSAGILFASAGDLDGDGLPDIIFSTTSSSGDLVAWHRNLGGGVFAPQQVLTGGAMDCRSIELADLDGDGDMDLALAIQFSDQYGWIENLGGGFFAPIEVFTSSSDRPLEVGVSDMDGDGDLDVVGVNVSQPRLVWFSNLGAGEFSAEQVLASPFAPSGLSVADLTGDGAGDVLVGTGGGTISVYENVGAPAVLEPLPSIGTAVQGDVEIISSDLDGDGDLEILTAARGDGKLAIYENLGGGSFGPQVVLPMPGSGVNRVQVADLNGDSHRDLLVTASISNELYWYPGDGSGQFGSPTLIDAGLGLPSDLAVADLDQDGDVDIVVSMFLGSDVVVYENTGAGSFASAQFLDGVPNPRHLVLGDVNGNGRTDIVASTALGIYWYRNLTGLQFSNTLPVSGAIADPGDVTLIDYDVDGDLDALWVNAFGSVDNWCENLGNGIWSATASSEPQLLLAGGLEPADLDGDGDSDVVMVQWQGPSAGVYWVENLGGGFGPPVLAAPLPLATLGPPADLDGDGDFDLLVGSMTRSSVGWAEVSLLPVAGELYCLPAARNSTGEFGTAFTTGSLDINADSLVLRAAQLPAGNFGMFLASPNQGQTPVAGSQGVLCLGASIGRFNGPGQLQLTGQAGTVALDIGTQAVATPSGAQPIQPGETWNFQLWYRDNNPATTSNFTGGVSLTFP